MTDPVVMTMEEILAAMANAIGIDVRESINVLRNEQNGVIGDPTALSTAARTIVGAIEEIRAAAANANANLGITENRALELLNGLQDRLLSGAGAAWDTFKEFQDAFSANTDAMTNLMNIIGTRVSFAVEQVLTDAQKGIAQRNIGLGNLQRDFVADYMAARHPAPAVPAP